MGRYDDKVIKVVKEENPRWGGATYWVETTEWPGEYRALCWRKLRSSERFGHCAQPAGYRTDHPGVGYCMYHENWSLKRTPAMIKTGKHAKMTRFTLREKIDDFVEKDQGDLFDLTKELGTLKVLLEEMIADFEYVDEKSKGIQIKRITDMVSSIRNTVNDISKIQSRNALTAAHVAYLRVTVADIFIKFIDDPKKRELAVKTLVSRIAGGENGDDRKIIKIAQEM